MISLNIEHIVGLLRVRKCGRVEKNEIKQPFFGVFVARIEARRASIHQSFEERDAVGALEPMPPYRQLCSLDSYA